MKWDGGGSNLVIRTDVTASAKQLLTDFPERVENGLGALALLALKPLDTRILAFLLGALLHVDIAKGHANNVTGGNVNGLVCVLIAAVMPILRSGNGVCLAEFLVHARWEEDIEHQGAHSVGLEGLEVDIVDGLDVWNKRGEDSCHLDVDFEDGEALGSELLLDVDEKLEEMRLV